MKSNFWILVFFLLIFQKTLSQTVIEGGVFDLHKKPVANAMIILYDDNTNKIIEYAQSGSNGSFALKKKHPTGIYRLEASKLGFERSEEHTSELQSRPHLVCRLLLEKKKKKTKNNSNDKLKNKTKETKISRLTIDQDSNVKTANLSISTKQP